MRACLRRKCDGNLKVVVVVAVGYGRNPEAPTQLTAMLISIRNRDWFILVIIIIIIIIIVVVVKTCQNKYSRFLDVDLKGKC